MCFNNHRWIVAIAAMLIAVSAPLFSTGTAAQGKSEPIRLAMIEGLSGPLAAAGQSWLRNLRYAVDAVNAQGGVKIRDTQGRWVKRPLQIDTLDGKGQVEDSLAMLRSATSNKIPFVLQGASSAVAGALIDAINKHNEREPNHRVLFLNYAAVATELTNEKCSPWHFRFDAHAGMRMHALTEVLKADPRVQRVYLINQDYSFGRDVERLAREQISAKRPNIQIVGSDLHPIGRVKDFTPYVSKMLALQADTVVTGNWGSDLALLVKAAREAGLSAKFYTFYANSLGAPAAIGVAGVGRVRAVAEWHPNVGGKESDAYVDQFRAQLENQGEDTQYLRARILVEMLAQAIEKAGSTEAVAVANALSGAQWKNGFHSALMRASDHQLQQPLYVSVMQAKGDGVKYDAEQSGYGFKTERYLSADQAWLPTTCQMKRSERQEKSRP
jgi:branched-chain amino acid transport system substrate-binding protein